MMKIKNCKFNLKCSCEPLEDKVESYDDIMYLYWKLKVKICKTNKYDTRQNNITFSSGDLGHNLINFVKDLSTMIGLEVAKDIETSLISSIFYEGTGDTSFCIQKYKYRDGTTCRHRYRYRITISKNNCEGLVLDYLEENDVRKFRDYVEKKIKKTFDK